MNKNTIIPTFNAMCAAAKNPEDLVRKYIETFGEEIKKFGKAKCDDMNQPMIVLYNYIDSSDFRNECEGCIWNFVDDMVTCAETYIWHRDCELYANDNRIKWIKQFV